MRKSKLKTWRSNVPYSTPKRKPREDRPKALPEVIPVAVAEARPKPEPKVQFRPGTCANYYTLTKRFCKGCDWEKPECVGIRKKAGVKRWEALR